MKKNYYKIAFLALLVASVGTANAQQCLTGGCTVSTAQYPPTTQSTSSAAFTPIAIDMYAGEYALCNVTAGVTYVWSLCAADGGVTGYDSQLTLFNGTTNAVLCYSDDFCGTDAKIGWTATYTGTVKIQVNDYGTAGCASNTTLTTLVWRTVPAGPDAAVAEVYTMGTISTANSNPHVVQAHITNTGTTTFTNLPVTLTVSGATSFSNVQTIPSLAVGAGITVTFPGYTSTATGTNTVTVSIPTDPVPSNNTKTVSQTVTVSNESYAYGPTPSGGAGFNSGVGEVAAKFYASAGATLTQVKATFDPLAGNPAPTYRVRIFNAAGTGGAPGTLLYTSTNQTAVAGMNTVNISPALAVPSTFYVSIEQVVAGSNMALGYQVEDPLRTNTFFANSNFVTPTWSDLGATAGIPFRLMVETVLSCGAPAQPSAIAGPATICGTSAVTYTVPAVTGATSYTWTLPAGWAGSSTTNTIVATPNSTGGTISVTATNACGTSLARTLAVTTSPGAPAQPGAITGAVTACSGTGTTYSVAPVSGASSYTWTLPNGWSGTSTTNSILAAVGTTGGTISVTAANGCGTSTAQTLAVSVAATPGLPGAITGNTNVCGNSSNLYSVPAVTGATSYIWTLPSGWSGTSTSNSINATVGSASGSITVVANNNCGTSNSSSLAVNVTPIPAQPNAITGPNALCQGASATYSVPVVTGATSYNWTLPSGWSGSSNTNTISATSGANGGTISVTVSNTCGTGAAQTLAVISTAGAPAQPAAITGPASVCPGANTTYSVAPVSGAGSYIWTLPNGWTGTSTTNTINTVAGTTAGTISVIASNGCGTSSAQTLAVSVSSISQPGAVTGNSSVCQGATATFTVQPVPGATSYNWTLPNGWTGSSTTNTITVTAGTTGGVVSVTATDGTCTSAAQNFNVSVDALPAVPTITTAGNVLSSSAATGNQWLLNGTAITGATGQFYTATQNGFYTVEVTNANGCTSVSAPYSHTMVGTADAFAAGLNLEVYPNPASDKVTIKADSELDMQVEVSNIIGSVILRSVAATANGKVEYQLNTSSLSQGIYLLTITNKQGTVTSRLVIQ